VAHPEATPHAQHAPAERPARDVVDELRECREALRAYCPSREPREDPLTRAARVDGKPS
jgi:hypothetical protein